MQQHTKWTYFIAMVSIHHYDMILSLFLSPSVYFITTYSSPLFGIVPSGGDISHITHFTNLQESAQIQNHYFRLIIPLSVNTDNHFCTLATFIGIFFLHKGKNTHLSSH